MMNLVPEYCDRFLSWLLLPATLYGAGGALLHAGRKGKTLRQILFEILGGAITANVAGPLIAVHAPDSWHCTLFFLAGWGGLELVGRVYDTMTQALERRLRRKFHGE